MWYSKTVEAGALDVLAGDLDPNLTFMGFNTKVSYGSKRSWPNPDSMYKYLKDKANYLESIKNDSNKFDKETKEIFYAINAIKKILEVYSKDPEDLPLYNRFIPIIIQYSKIIGRNNFEIGLSDYNVVNSYLEVHNFIYNIGYKRLLALYKEGAILPISIAYALVTNSDLRASSNLQDSEERQSLRNLLLNNQKYTFLDKLDANKYSSDEIVDNIVDLRSNQIQSICDGSGISFTDYMAFFTKLVESNYFNLINMDRNFVKPLITSSKEYDYIVFLHSIKSKFTADLYPKY